MQPVPYPPLNQALFQEFQGLSACTAGLSCSLRPHAWSWQLLGKVSFPFSIWHVGWIPLPAPDCASQGLFELSPEGASCSVASVGQKQNAENPYLPPSPKPLISGPPQPEAPPSFPQLLCCHIC